MCDNPKCCPPQYGGCLFIVPRAPEPPSAFSVADLENAEVLWSYREPEVGAAGDPAEPAPPVTVGEREPYTPEGSSRDVGRWNVFVDGVPTDVYVTRPRANMKLLKIGEARFLRHNVTGGCYELMPETRREEIDLEGPEDVAAWTIVVLRYRTRVLVDAAAATEQRTGGSSSE
jgi:hypothetical protein